MSHEEIALITACRWVAIVLLLRFPMLLIEGVVEFMKSDSAGDLLFLVLWTRGSKVS